MKILEGCRGGGNYRYIVGGIPCTESLHTIFLQRKDHIHDNVNNFKFQ